MQRQGSPPPPRWVFHAVVTSCLFTSTNRSCSPSFCPTRAPLRSPLFPPVSHHYLTPSPFPSLCLSLCPPTTISFLLLLHCPPLLSHVYCSRKSSTDTSMCVFVHVCVCVCVTTVRTVSKAHTITSEGGGIFFFNACVCQTL